MAWYLPILIFLARICDVSIGTVRVITVIRGHKLISAVLGFFEVVIWIFAIASVVQHITESIWCVVAYGGGFAAGTLIGMMIEEKLALGDQIIRAVNREGDRDLAGHMRSLGYRVTQIDAKTAFGKAELCFLVVPRRQTPEATRLIQEHCPEAYLTVEDIRSQSGPRIFRSPASELPIWKRLIKFK